MNNGMCYNFIIALTEVSILILLITCLCMIPLRGLATKIAKENEPEEIPAEFPK
jgi:hypothetical protein